MTTSSTAAGPAVLAPAAIAAILGCAAPAELVVETEAPTADPLVDVRASDPRIVVELPYATDQNFAARVLYPVDRCLLRESAMERLSQVQTTLESAGFGLKVWDGYRPWSVQVAMWEIFPDPKFVADPTRGSRHNRGMAVDVTLTDADGNELEMPTRHDEFTDAASIGAELASSEIHLRREILRAAMEHAGFTTLSSEWWHYDAPGWREAPVLDVRLEDVR